jgi:hypothetical protein
MATLQEQQLAKDIVIWNPTTAGDLIANVYKTIVQAIRETSTAAAGTDATG